MGEAARVCLCIDLRSFYATVEAVDRGLDPMEARLVVADPDRSANTICLAVSPRLKAEGVRNRCRMAEVPRGRGVVVARPRMARYLEASCEVVACLLEHVSADDVHVYSVDESFIEIGPYLPYYGLTPRAMAKRLQGAVAERLGYPATCGVGPNPVVAKVALDVLAKHDAEGICELDLAAFYRDIWFHRPITDIWQVGPATARRLASAGIADLAGVAAADPRELERLLGPARARLLVDHAWGLEPTTVAEASAWEPRGRSMARGQVLLRDYTTAEAATVVREMADDLALSAESGGWDAERLTLKFGGLQWGYLGGHVPLGDGPWELDIPLTPIEDQPMLTTGPCTLSCNARFGGPWDSSTMGPYPQVEVQFREIEVTATGCTLFWADPEQTEEAQAPKGIFLMMKDGAELELDTSGSSWHQQPDGSVVTRKCWPVPVDLSQAESLRYGDEQVLELK